MMLRLLTLGVTVAALVAIVTSALILQGTSGPASASGPIDATGYWVSQYVDAFGTPIGTCTTHVTQTVNDISWTGMCGPFPTSASGTIDQTTGAFTATGTTGSVTVETTGIVAKDGQTSSGSWSTTTSGSGTFTAHQKPKPPTSTPTNTPTDTPTPTPCAPEGCPTSTPTFSPTDTRTPTNTPTQTNTPTVTNTPSPTSTPSAIVSVIPSSMNASRGVAISVQIQVASVANLGAYEFTLSYDPNVLTWLFAGNEQFLGSSGRPVTCLSPIIEPDSVRFGCFTTGPVPPGASGGGTLATLTFSTSCGGGTSPLTLESALLSEVFGASIPTQSTTDGAVILAGELCGAPDPDSDLDACSNSRENGSNPASGGMRNALRFWDFFDTPNTQNVRDKSIAGTDFFALLGRFGSQGSPGINPLSAPPPAPAYHTAFDRGASSGPNPWNLTAANGSVDGLDFFGLLAQFGHSCA